MKRIINKFRGILRKILGVPDEIKLVFFSDFPDGKLEGAPSQIGRFSLIDYGGNVKIGKTSTMYFISISENQHKNDNLIYKNQHKKRK